ncbi:fimbrial biogenesis chaperone [Yersinia kristensenii]|uniref:fimbrial biogenesis chaperone n=1 Tax=Yersinia kristensenii TaxID=28152 RepID=UPI0005E89AF6|nr:molecular chaperone [Yersinia kristensenii]MDA5472680.1 molecular chaperone [Yersinia kristensenii]MDA5478415.1 molecular chaperone [Yersinia kristensenii]MDA5505344.1 molecular chaperone [Yersinia kristensenii]NIK94231.1 molecular chaperone [Yersinia kristensenii]NIL05857.1 molecular chaperone [Yersinia kristensenii]
MARFLLFISMIFVSSVAQADGFGINVTRLIYPQGAGNISAVLRNTTAALPYLVQVSVSGAKESYTAAPFLVTPPLFRLEPNSVNQVRISGQNINLPKDRESVFYFHASAIPAGSPSETIVQPTASDVTAQFGIGNIIKLFYRPKDLPSSPAIAQQNLQFSRSKMGLKVNNPSPYFISFASLNVGGKRLKLDRPDELMIAPFSSHIYPTMAAHGAVQWQTINDQGGRDEFNQPLP